MVKEHGGSQGKFMMMLIWLMMSKTQTMTPRKPRCRFSNNSKVINIGFEMCANLNSVS